MKTDTVPAHAVEVGDVITLGSEDTFTVVEVSDDEKVAITLDDGDGMHETFYFAPFEDITLYLGEDDVEFEDAPIED